jgi:hypothetical protein
MKTGSACFRVSNVIRRPRELGYDLMPGACRARNRCSEMEGREIAMLASIIVLPFHRPVSYSRVSGNNGRVSLIARDTYANRPIALA